MHLTLNKFLLPLAALLGLAVAFGQTQDTSGNGLLKGSFRVPACRRPECRWELQSDGDHRNLRHHHVRWRGELYTHRDHGGQHRFGRRAAAPERYRGPMRSAPTERATSPIRCIRPISTTTFMEPWRRACTREARRSREEVGNSQRYFYRHSGRLRAHQCKLHLALSDGSTGFHRRGSTAIKNALFELTPNGKGGFGTISSERAGGQPERQLTDAVHHGRDL